MKRTRHSMTHEGIVRGNDSRTPRDFQKRVLLRETKTLWVSEAGTKYRKKGGHMTNGDWPLLHLDLSTVRPL